MVKLIELRKDLYQKLSKVASILFPLEAEAIICGNVSNEIFKAEEVVISPEISFTHGTEDIGFYEEASSFKDFVGRVKKQIANTEVFRLSSLADKRHESERLFRKYKECQRRRAAQECLLQHIELTDCVKCNAFGPMVHVGFDWATKKQPFFCWHTHPTSDFGKLSSVSSPSFMDTLEILKLLEKKLHILGEVITTVFESGKTSSKCFLAPTSVGWANAIFHPDKYEKNLERIEVLMKIT